MPSLWIEAQHMIANYSYTIGVAGTVVLRFISLKTSDHNSHYNDGIIGAIASQITSLACECLLSRLIRRRSKKTSKLRVTGLGAGNLPESGEFPAQRVSNPANVSIWWLHHEIRWKFCFAPIIILTDKTTFFTWHNGCSVLACANTCSRQCHG